MKFQGFFAKSIVGMVMGAMLVGTSIAKASTETGVVLECSSGKVSMRDRVNVKLTKNANGQLTAEVESLKGQKGQAVVARRGVTEKHGPAGTTYKSESGDFQMKVNGAKTAHVTFKGAVNSKVNCQKSNGLFEQI